MDLEAIWAAGQQKEGLTSCLRQLGSSSDELYMRYALEFALELADETALARLADSESQNPDFLALKSQLWWQRGRLQEALEIAQRAYKQQPSFLTAYALGTVVALRSTQEAEGWLREALRHAEETGQPHRAVQAAAALALLQVALGAYTQAETWAGWGINLADHLGMKHPGVRNTLLLAQGYAQILGGRLLSLPPLDTTQPDAALAQGDFLLALGDAESALEAYAALDRLPPMRAMRLFILARKVRALLELGQFEEALQIGQKAYTLGQGLPEFFHDWGELAYLLPTSLLDPSVAVEGLPKLLERSMKRQRAPFSAMVALHLARAYLTLGMEGKAKAALREAWRVLEGLSPAGLRFLAGPAHLFQEVFDLLQPVPHLRLHFLGIPSAWLASSQIKLSPRQQEIVAALAAHPEGLNAERLALWVWGEQGRPDVVRAEVQRLREGLPILGRPYRLYGTVWADFLVVRDRLLQWDLSGALALYGGPLLPGSEAPGVVELREELWSLIKTALHSRGTPEQVYEVALLENDPELWHMASERLPETDPRQALLKARLKRFLTFD